MFRLISRLVPQVAKQVAKKPFQPAAINIAIPAARTFCTAWNNEYEEEEELPKDPKERMRELRDRRLMEGKVMLETKYRVVDGLSRIEKLTTAEIVELITCVEVSDMKLRKYQVEKFRNELMRRSDIGATAEQMADLLADINHLCPESLDHAEFFTCINKALEATPEFTPELFAEAVSGLHSFVYVDPALRAILPTLTSHLKRITETFTCDDIGLVLYGLHGMNSEYPEAKALIAAVTERLQHAEGRFSANGYSNALHGLFFMSSEHDEVRALVQELNNRATWEQFTAPEFGNAFLGLNALSSEHPETLELTRLLADKLAQSDVILTSRLIGGMVYGCTSMRADKPEVLEMLKALADKILSSKEFMRHYDVELAVEALQNMDASVDEVKAIFSALHIKSKMCKPELDVDTLRRLQTAAGVKVYSENPYLVDLNSDEVPQVMVDSGRDDDDYDSDGLDFDAESEEDEGEEEEEGDVVDLKDVDDIDDEKKK